MERTQIYLTQAEQEGLRRLAARRGVTVSALIRAAVDQYLETAAESDWRERRLAAFGLWTGREAIDLERLRREERLADWHAAD
ncbi:MAG: ribbon-helix-helix domain-containing protein [Saprospiraceae bacterium]|nr:ribbon-helix-helix domain-containing protein [Saprospiraceae bacterium]MDW8322550.1 CopG family transcriptional regulator [Burkholderiales bacterium]MDW8485379.1 CopG family transcriptional regulator [Saprospiraceae bacterium]